MPTMGRKRAVTQGPTSTPEPPPENIDSTRKITLYEQSREDRIRQNRERLQKLGIFELSDKIRTSAPKRTYQRRVSAQGPATAPSRRSSRLQNVTPITYTEKPLKKKEARDLANQRIVLEEGAKPEIYMEEHNKLLGNTERSWELFVDGYGKDGKRIYDSVEGKTCHQSRLQNVTPISYTEIPLKKKEAGDLANQRIVLEEGAKPKIYMEEHDKPLGNIERSWELFVGGYGKDGKRIYDSVEGKTCHHSRLQNVTPISYTEIPLKKKEAGDLANKRIVLEEGAKPEIYMEEHDKLLGNTERSWELCVDGYGKDGKRIYDSVEGKTCHQCRQKTLGHRTRCCKCNMVQGQFCGDCLYMRYGEHVLEALENPNWICPVCRGICNCSLCRQAKGWPPTGLLYRKISRLGYKSVAHFLIQTRRAQPNEETPDSVCHASVKRALPFSEYEDIVTKGSPKSRKDDTRVLNGKTEDAGKEGMPLIHAKRPLSFTSKEAVGTVPGEGNANKGLSEPKVKGKPDEYKSENGREVGVIREKNHATRKRKYALSAGSDEDSIGARLRQRRTMSGSNDLALKVKSSELELLLNGSGTGLDLVVATNHGWEPAVEGKPKEAEEVRVIGEEKPKRKCAVSPGSNQDSIGARLRQRRTMSGSNDLALKVKSSELEVLSNGSGTGLDLVVATNHGWEPAVEGKPKEAEEVRVIGEEKPKRKCAVSPGSNQDSIGARLRQRRTMSGSNDLALKVKSSELEVLSNGSETGLDLVVATNHGLEPAVEGKPKEAEEVGVIGEEKPKRKCAVSTGSNQDSIGARLRQRRRVQNGDNDMAI